MVAILQVDLPLVYKISERLILDVYVIETSVVFRFFDDSKS